MHVDEAGSDHLAGRIDYPRGLRMIETSDSDNAPRTDSDIGLDPWIASTIDNVAASDDNVVGLREYAWTGHGHKREQKRPKFQHGPP
jgi:hypothetical protein